MNSDQIKEQVEDLQEQAGEMAQNFKERAMEWKETARENITNFARTTDDYVHDNPWPAIGITAAFAFALGLVIGMRRR